MDAGLKVAVARKNRCCDEIVVGDGLLNLGVEWSGVSDACRAAVADGLESEPVEIRLEAGLLKVCGDDTGAGSQGGLHRGVHGESGLDGLPGQEARREHDAGVAGVGATGDGGDEHAAVADSALASMLAMEGGFWHLGEGVRSGAVANHLLLVLGDRGVAPRDGGIGTEGSPVLAVATLGDRLGEEFSEDRLELR